MSHPAYDGGIGQILRNVYGINSETQVQILDGTICFGFAWH